MSVHNLDEVKQLQCHPKALFGGTTYINAKDNARFAAVPDCLDLPGYANESGLLRPGNRYVKMRQPLSRGYLIEEITQVAAVVVRLTEESHPHPRNHACGTPPDASTDFPRSCRITLPM